MAGSSLLLLIDDIAAVLDDVSLMTKVAAKKTAGVLGDDLALNAQQVSGVKADRELQRTAIGDALVTAVDRLEDLPVKSKVVVLLSDGESNIDAMRVDLLAATGAIGLAADPFEIDSSAASPGRIRDRTRSAPCPGPGAGHRAQNAPRGW